MDRSTVVCIFSIVLLILQSTQGAELNSEATLNCNGKEFKCINATHYRPCSLMERSGQQPQYMINGVVLPCAAGKSCDEASSFGCGGVARTAQPVEQPSQIPVQVTIVQEPIKETPAVVEPVAAPAKSLPVNEPAAAAAPVATPEPAVASSTEQVRAVVAEETKSAEAAAAPAPAPAAAPATPAPAANATDAAKADETKSKKKFSFKGLKKVGPIRLVNGFRAATWRPKISLDSQKDVADSLRKRIYERRNKYEKFVDNVLGKASPIESTAIAVEPKPDAKQPAPGAPIQHDSSDSCEGEGSCGDEYDSCEAGSDDCDDGDDDSSSADDDDSDSSSDSDSSDDDCDDEDELEPGEGEAVWEEEEVEGGIEIVEECPDDEDDCDDGDDSCDSDDSGYEWEDGIESTAVVNAGDDDCDDTSDSSSCEDDSSSGSSSDDDDDDDDDSDSCSDDDEECKKKRKQANKNKKKKSGSKKKKNGSKKSAVKPANSEKPTAEKSTDGKKTDAKSEAVQKKKPTEKKKVRYPPVQKIRKSLMSAFANVTEAITPARKRNIGRKGSSGGSGVIGTAATGLQNAVLNKVDDLFAIKDNGLFNKNKGGNSDENTGCSIVEGWTCPRQGRYAHPIDCQKYVQCAKTGPFSKTLQNTVYECEDDESYDPNIRSCTTDWSSCEALEQCLYHRQLIEDPSDDNSYFICIRDSSKKFKETYNLYRRDCTPGRIYDPDYQMCLESSDYRRISKEKRRRQQIKKQKQCQKKKAQKKNKKKKSPQKKH